MSLRTWLLAGTSLAALTFAPIGSATAQSTELLAAYASYVDAQASGDAGAIAAALQPLADLCAAGGYANVDDCIAVLAAAAAEPTSAEPTTEAPAEAPATTPPAATEPQPAAAQPVPAEQPAPTAEQPAAPVGPSPASDPALIAAYESYVAASSGTDETAKANAEAAFMTECTRLGVVSLDECLALVTGGGSAGVQPTVAPPTGDAVDASGQPLEDVPNVEATGAGIAPVLDSAKDATTEGQAAAPAVGTTAEQPAPPASDAEAQTESAPAPEAEVIATVDAEGERIDTLPIEQPRDAEIIVQTQDNRLIFNFELNLIIYTPYDDRDRIGREGDEVYYERLDNGRIRQVIIREDGTKVITVWNRYGEIIRRVKVRPDGTRIVMIFDHDDRDDRWRDPGNDLPPFRLPISVRDYVLYSDIAEESDIERFLAEPPLERAARIYSVDEVKRSARIRDTIRRVEIGDLTFDTGEATVERDQVGSLTKVANAILRLIERNPGEVFLIEGHTDAIGSDESNLELSDRRAETVATLLTDLYGVPPENLVTQGYGERYLKVETEEAERANRRATVRRITPLVAPVAQQ